MRVHPELSATIRAARRRLRVLMSLRWVSRFLVWTACVSLVWIIAAHLRLVHEPAVTPLTLLAASAMAAGLAFAFATPLTSFRVAWLLDVRGRTGDRLASAVEFGSREQQDPLVLRQVADAAASAAALDLKTLYPIVVPKEGIAALVLAIIAVAAMFLPSLPVFWSAQQKKEAAEVRNEGRRIERLARQAEQSAARNRLAETRTAALEARRLAEAMKRGSLDKKQSLISLQKLTDRLSRRQDMLARAAGSASPAVRKRMDDLARTFARRQMEQAAARSGRTNPADASAERLMQSFFQALRSGDARAQNEALQRLADLTQSGQLSAASIARLQRQLQQISQALSDTQLRQLAGQLAEIAKLMERMKLDPRTLQRLAEMMRQAGGT
ncbi:MAG: hypothetical protein ACP5VE_03035 [Chthonomonadales bacterium]